MREHSPENATRGCPIQLRPVVAYADLGHGNLFVKDVSAPKDTVGVQRPSWWAPERAACLLRFTELVILAMAGIRLLRRRVESQTDTIPATLESTAEGILVVDNPGRIKAFNKKFAELWRIPESILSSGNDKVTIGYVTSQLNDPEGFRAAISKLHAHAGEHSNGVLEFRNGQVSERHAEL